MTTHSAVRCFFAGLGLMLIAGSVSAQTVRTDVPGFVVQYLGAGTPMAINDWNQAVGFREVSGVRRAVLFDGSMQDLPSLAAGAACEARDINEMGSIVGFCAPSVNKTGRAVIWTKSEGTYTVTQIPTFAGDTGSAAVAINNLGEVLGIRNFRLSSGMQVGASFIWRASSGPIDVLKTYGLNDFPTDINDAGQVLLDQKLLDLRSGQVTDLGVPTGPPSYIAVRTAAISRNGNVAGTAVPASSSSPQRLVRHSAGGWQVLGGWGQGDSASGLNDAGTVVGRGVPYLGSGSGGYKGVIWFDQIRTLLYADDFLLESERDWIVLSAIALNGDNSGGVAGTGRIIGVGNNLVTGEYGAIMLRPAGPLPVPNAPSSFQATPRQANWQQPYHAIALSWSDNSRTDFGFKVERTVAGQVAWVELARVNGTSYEDTAGSPGVTYDYRVRAIGLAGDSAASATARATFPQTSIDTTPPTVVFVAPVSGTQVSGNTQIVVDASDDRGLNFIDVQYQPNMGQPRICSAAAGGALTYRLTCTWNTRDLAPGTYELTAYASDAIGNYKTQTINVMVGGAAAPTVRVSSVSLSASTKKNSTTVAAGVTVVNQDGTPVQGAGVSVAWTTPTGPKTGFANTDRKGVASFSIPGSPGTFSVTVTNVAMTGYTFDLAASQLSGTIVVR